MMIPFLRALYLSEHGIGETKIDYAQLLQEIESSSTGAQIYALLKEAERLRSVPAFFFAALSRIYQACFMQNMVIRHETELLLRKFEANGIPVIPLKGTMLAERYFGHFAARGTSDIDLLVAPEHIQAALACVANAGYCTPLKENPEHYHLEWTKTSSGLPEPLPVELHWSLAPSGTSRMDMRTAWENSIRLDGYDNVRVWNATYTFYALCLHGASHLMDSAKYILDLLHLLVRHREGIDMEWIWNQARSDGTSRRVVAALACLYGHFPELRSVKPLPFEPRLRFWKPDAESGSIRRTIRKLTVMDSWRYRLGYLFRTVIPSEALARYSLDDAGSPRSLPALYYRLYKQRLRKLIRGA
ncbi:nucleotidyltransferase family protein [Cohnella sp.]|uniref:nucleotidyltransferase family protein n=1 Tax=Cohnella sp. TaxID=1883426 RepID=UPI0035685CEE